MGKDTKTHLIKTERAFFQAVERGDKRFEIRKNDRDYKPKDIVILHETVDGKRTGRESLPLEIKYVLKDATQYGLAEGYCIFNW